jgi:hypothetical protein
MTLTSYSSLVGENDQGKPYLVPGENPRWTLCQIAMGRRPKALEFMLWIRDRWYEYCKSVTDGVIPQMETAFSFLCKRYGVEETQKDFDAWLYRIVIEQIEQG